MAVDSAGAFLYTDLGHFMIPAVPGSLAPIYPITLTSAANKNVPWTADSIGSFVFAADKTPGFLDSFQIDPATGAITAAPGSPYAVSSGLRAIAVTGYPNQFSAPAVTFSPITFAFSGTLIGQIASFPIKLTNAGFAALTFGTISIAGANPADFSQTNNCPSTLGSGANCTFNVTFMPQAVGERAASLNVADNAAGSPQIVVLSGEGLNPTPAVTLVPGSFSYPSAMVGGTGASQGFALTNSGTGTLHISSIALYGPNPGDFTQANTCGATLAVGASCEITVTFKPQAVGTRTANVTIVDDAANSPQTMALAGAGTAPFTIAPVSNTLVLVPGQSSQLGMQFTSMPNFVGTVSFACSGAPTGSTCAISPLSLPVAGQTATQLSLVVNSTSSAMFVRPQFQPLPGNWRAPVSTKVLLGLFLSVAFWRRRKLAFGFDFGRPGLSHFAIVAVFSMAPIISGCGGAGGTQITPPAGPSAGAYTLTVVATSGNVSVATSITLNVQ